jgi:hypothetical protein
MVRQPSGSILIWPKAVEENPVYYVKCSRQGMQHLPYCPERSIDSDMTDLTPRSSCPKSDLETFGVFRTCSPAAEALEHRVTFYLMDLAELFHLLP